MPKLFDMDAYRANEEQDYSADACECARALVVHRTPPDVGKDGNMHVRSFTGTYVQNLSEPAVDTGVVVPLVSRPIQHEILESLRQILEMWALPCVGDTGTRGREHGRGELLKLWRASR